MITNCSGEGKKNKRNEKRNVGCHSQNSPVMERGMLNNGCSCPEIDAIEYVTISIPWTID